MAERLSAFERALRFLKTREFGQAELRERLGDYPDAEVSEALERLSTEGWQSDTRAIESYLGKLEGNRAKGREVMRYELGERGFDGEMIEDALAALPDEEERKESLLRCQSKTRSEAQQARFLASRGFPTDEE